MHEGGRLPQLWRLSSEHEGKKEEKTERKTSGLAWKEGLENGKQVRTSSGNIKNMPSSARMQFLLPLSCYPLKDVSHASCGRP